MINPDFLRTFLSLCETRHFTRTAERLHMTQPGVSQHLQRLEEHFGASLVQRTRGQFHLTDAGRRVEVYARELFAAHDKFKAGLGEDSPQRGVCRYSAPGSFGLLLYDTLLTHGKKFPELRMDLLVAPNAEIEKLLLEERIDVGFSTRPPQDDRLAATEVFHEQLLLVCPRGIGPTDWPALLRLGFINHPDGFHHARRLFEANYPGEFTTMQAIPLRGFINQISRILDPVAEGLGFTVLPALAFERSARKKELRAVKLKHVVKDPVLRLVRKGEQLPQRYALFEERLHRELRKV